MEVRNGFIIVVQDLFGIEKLVRMRKISLQ